MCTERSKIRYHERTGCEFCHVLACSFYQIFSFSVTQDPVVQIAKNIHISLIQMYSLVFRYDDAAGGKLCNVVMTDETTSTDLKQIDGV